MFGDMMNKLNEMKKQVEESKLRLNNITVQGTSCQGQLKVIMNGNREAKDVMLPEHFNQMEKEELQDLLLLAINEALNSAKKVEEVEMQGAAKGILPGMGF
jgi:nucleoid-associated protein EbfC